MKKACIVLVLWVVFVSGLATAQSIVTVNTPRPDITVTGTATLIAAQNEFRTVLNVTNNSSTVAVRWGDATVTASQGQRIAASSTVAIENQGAIYMISEGADVTVSLTEEAR